MVKINKLLHLRKFLIYLLKRKNKRYYQKYSSINYKVGYLIDLNKNYLSELKMKIKNKKKRRCKPSLKYMRCHKKHELEESLLYKIRKIEFPKLECLFTSFKQCRINYTRWPVK